MTIVDPHLMEFHIPGTYCLTERIENKLMSHFVGFDYESDGAITLIWRYYDGLEAFRICRYLTHMCNVSKSALENVYDIDSSTCISAYGIHAKIRFFMLEEVNEYSLILMPLEFRTETTLGDGYDTKIYIKFKVA